MTDADGAETDAGVDPTSAAAPSTMSLGTEEVRFRYARPGDEAQIVSVLETAFGEFYATAKPVDGPDYIRWFTEAHDSHQSSMEVAAIGSTIVSVTGALYRPIKFGLRTMYGTAGGIGGATLPQYQRRGINRAKGEWADSVEDPPRTASVATRRAETRDRGKQQVPSGGRMDVYLSVQRPLRAAHDRKDGAAIFNVLPATALALWSRLRPAIGGRGARDVTVETLDAFDGRFEPFLEQASAAWDVIPVRSIEYLNWRFCDRRAGKFIVRSAQLEDELVGYSVLHVVGSRGQIMDVLALPGRLDVVRTLIADAVQQLGESGTAAVECWMLREQPYAQVLRRTGFMRLPARSAEIADEVGWDGSGIGAVERALLMSPSTRVHLVRADFDGI